MKKLGAKIAMFLVDGVVSLCACGVWCLYEIQWRFESLGQMLWRYIYNNYAD